ncbi:MAG: hypothetical protein U0667_17240 [Chloroflexota bacterium]
MAAAYFDAAYFDSAYFDSQPFAWPHGTVVTLSAVEVPTATLVAVPTPTATLDGA